MTYEFSGFRADTATGTVHCGAEAVHVTPVEFRVLSILLAKGAGLVSNEEFYEAVWKQSPDVGNDTLRQHIRGLRRKLGADLIINVRNEGYRLATEVVVVGTPAETERKETAPAEAPLIIPSTIEAPSVPLFRGFPSLPVTIALAFLLPIAYLLGTAGQQLLPFSNFIRITDDGNPKAGPLWSDGKRIWFKEVLNSKDWIASVSASGGPVTRENVPVLSGDLQLLAARAPGPELLFQGCNSLGASYLWAWTPGRTPLPVVLSGASSAAWTAGRRDSFAAMNADGLVFYDHGAVTRSISALGRVGDLRWLPARNLLRFTRYDAAEQPGIWEMRTPDGIPEPVSRYPKGARAGGWNHDGSIFAFTARVSQSSDIWVESQGAGGANRLVRMTGGPMDFEYASPSPDGRSILAIGTQQRGELVRFDAIRKRFARYLDGINAVDLDFSRDGDWVAYIRLPDRTLWKAHADGSAAVQLTSPPMDSAQPHWSPDGSRIAFMGSVPGAVYRIYVVAASGGNPAPLTSDGAEQGVPTWSPDGSMIVFGDRNHFKPLDMAIHLLNVKTGAVYELPASGGMWTPRWSPDGAYILAISTDFRRLMLYEWGSRKWRDLGNFGGIEHPSWSADSAHIVFRGIRARPAQSALYRVDVRSGEVERIVDLEGFTAGPEEWYGLAPDGAPLAARGIRIQEIYSIPFPENFR